MNIVFDLWGIKMIRTPDSLEIHFIGKNGTSGWENETWSVSPALYDLRAVENEFYAILENSCRCSIYYTGTEKRCEYIKFFLIRIMSFLKTEEDRESLWETKGYIENISVNEISIPSERFWFF